MASLANHTELPGHELWADLLFHRALKGLLAGKKLKIMIKAPISYQAQSRNTRLELRENGEVFSPSLYAMLVQPWRSVRDSVHPLPIHGFFSSLGAFEHQGWSYNSPD